MCESPFPNLSRPCVWCRRRRCTVWCWSWRQEASCRPSSAATRTGDFRRKSPDRTSVSWSPLSTTSTSGAWRTGKATSMLPCSSLVSSWPLLSCPLLWCSVLSCSAKVFLLLRSCLSYSHLSLTSRVVFCFVLLCKVSLDLSYPLLSSIVMLGCSANSSLVLSILLCPVLYCDVLSCSAKSSLVLSILPCPVLSCGVLFCLALQSPVWVCLTLSCPVCPALLCFVLICPALYCLFLYCFI